MTRSKLMPALLCGLLLTAGAGSGRSEPPKPTDDEPTIDPSDVQRFYAKILPELEAGRRPEAANQLMMILFSTQSNPVLGWYGPGRSRYDWIWLAARFDANRDGKILRQEFHGPATFWSRLDRDSDGALTQDDLDWNETSEWMRRQAQAQRQFRALDTDDDGQLTPEEWKAYFGRIAGSKGTVSPMEFAQALLPPPSPYSSITGQRMTLKLRHDRLIGVLKGDVGSFNEGPELGQPAPDFTLKALDGQGSITLSSFRGKRPVVLTFGSYTCPPYRALSPGLNPLHERYGDSVEFLSVYVREAHPTDGWLTEGNSRIGIEEKQPTNQSERLAVAQKYCSVAKPSFPLLVDEFDDRVGHAYSGMPNRLYLIDREGRVAYKSGRGPVGYKTGELEQAIVIYLLDQNSSTSTSQPASASARADDASTTRNRARVAGASPAR
jgi:thiol-disulfide isomerase/thioredoxin